ncbi:MAG: hypothetical protein V3S01_08160 [Dehalococcoidia bacterium]
MREFTNKVLDALIDLSNDDISEAEFIDFVRMAAFRMTLEANK